MKKKVLEVSAVASLLQNTPPLHARPLCRRPRPVRPGAIMRVPPLPGPGDRALSARGRAGVVRGGGEQRGRTCRRAGVCFFLFRQGPAHEGVPDLPVRSGESVRVPAVCPGLHPVVGCRRIWTRPGLRAAFPRESPPWGALWTDALTSLSSPHSHPQLQPRLRWPAPLPDVQGGHQ